MSFQKRFNPSFTSPFNHPYQDKPRVQVVFPDNSPHTQQSFKEECDINTIMRRYQATGQLPAMNETAPQYLDVSGMEFQSAMEFVAGAQSMFNDMPSEVRARFQNDPVQFLDFTSREENRAEMHAMGLLKPEAASKPAAPTQPLTSLKNNPTAAEITAKGAE